MGSTLLSGPIFLFFKDNTLNIFDFVLTVRQIKTFENLGTCDGQSPLLIYCSPIRTHRTKVSVPVITVGTPVQTHIIIDTQTQLTTAEVTAPFTTSDMEFLHTASSSNTFTVFSGFYNHTQSPE